MTSTTTPIKFLCSYGGRIMPRNSDGKLRYVGGHTRVLTVDRSISFSELMVRLGEFCGASVQIKCQLPDGDLETLISVTSDEDLLNILSIYDATNSPKIRAILSPPKYLKSISPPPQLPLSPPSRVGCEYELVHARRPYVNLSKSQRLCYVVVSHRGDLVI